MSTRVWIINQYTSTPTTGMGGRSYYLSKELAKLGYEVTLVSGSYSHLLKRLPETDGQFTTRQIEGFRHVLVRTIPYPQARSPRRAVNWFLFSWALTRLRRALGDSPDLVVYSSPSPIGFLGAKKLASDARAPLVLDVRDLWPLTLIELGGVSPKHPLMRSMSAVEKLAYRDADLVTSNLKQSVEHMASLGMDRSKFRWLPNGISLDEVCRPEPLAKDFLSRWPKDKFVVTYAGTIGMVNCMDVFIEAAKLLRARGDIEFVLVGKGAVKEKLMKQARDYGLESVHFFDPVEKTQVQSVLERSDALFLSWSNAPIYRFGIGANKIPEYMYSQKPVVMSYSGAQDPIRSSDCGLVVPAQDPQALADALLRLAEMPAEQRQEMGRKGRAYALEHFSYERIARRLDESFTELLEARAKSARPAPQARAS